MKKIKDLILPISLVLLFLIIVVFIPMYMHNKLIYQHAITLHTNDYWNNILNDESLSKDVKVSVIKLYTQSMQRAIIEYADFRVVIVSIAVIISTLIIILGLTLLKLYNNKEITITLIITGIFTILIYILWYKLISSSLII